MMRLLALLVLAALLTACNGDEAMPLATASATATESPGASPTPRLTATASPAATALPSSTPAGAQPTPTLTPTTGTGVAGVALVGPSCPVQREDDPCPDKPWQGIVVARTLSGAEAGRATTDAQGRFSIQLVPGTYSLVTLTSGVFPSPVSVQVTVTFGPGHAGRAVLDSGIR